jgi:RNA polymerase sigma-70 factor (ECF subfamily)
MPIPTVAVDRTLLIIRHTLSTYFGRRNLDAHVPARYRFVVTEGRPTDEALYADWAGGNRRAGEALIDRYLGRMQRFFVNKVGMRDEMGDLVAETFKKCAEMLGRFRGESRFESYLYGIARNVLREHVRRCHKLDIDPDLGVTAARDLGPSQSSIAGKRHEQQLLLEALRALPLELQIVVELAYFEEASRSAIAEILDLPEGTVATRLRRARRLLEENLLALAGDPALRHTTVTNLDAWARSLRELVASLDAQ